MPQRPDDEESISRKDGLFPAPSIGRNARQRTRDKGKETRTGSDEALVQRAERPIREIESHGDEGGGYDPGAETQNQREAGIPVWKEIGCIYSLIAKK